ncbi:hypothetical protein ON010_g15943 [Phytophthora cinnamomi]|nr:hypothetical protein ON010_g15943 [Phytophthora cinnamomi]
MGAAERLAGGRSGNGEGVRRAVRAGAAEVLPSSLPPEPQDVYEMEVDTKAPVFRQQWRQSPAQEAEIRSWVEEILNAGLIRPSSSPHRAPTFCVKKPVGWQIVHDYQAMNNHPRFCEGFARDAGPLFDMLKPKENPQQKAKLTWTSEQTQRFERLKERVSSTPVIAIADFQKPFYLRMDASDFSIGDKPFVVETLEDVFSQKRISRRIARWYDELSEYAVTFKYIPGKSNIVADGISRRADFQERHALQAIISVSAVQSRMETGVQALIEEAVNRYSEDPHTENIIRALKTNAPWAQPRDPSVADVGERDVGDDGEQRREANAHVERGHGNNGRHRSGPGAVGGAKRTPLSGRVDEEWHSQQDSRLAVGTRGLSRHGGQGTRLRATAATEQNLRARAHIETACSASCIARRSEHAHEERGR